MAHDDTSLRYLLKELRHQRRKIGFLGKIVSPGKGRVESKTDTRGTPAELHAQDVEHQRLHRIGPMQQRRVASTLANPGGGHRVLHRTQESVLYAGEQLHML